MALAAQNFLIPNGTFFAVLIIFLIVLAVIGKFVVPPIKVVLDEREEQLTQTSKDNRAATEEFEHAESEYRDAMKSARGEATGIRDEARAKGRESLDEMKQRATSEADSVLSEATSELNAQGEQAATQARADVGALSSDLAGRVLGLDVSADSKLSATLERLTSDQREKSGTVN